MAARHEQAVSAERQVRTRVSELRLDDLHRRAGAELPDRPMVTRILQRVPLAEI